MTIEGVWYLMTGDEPFDLARNARVTFAADGTVEMTGNPDLHGRYRVEGGTLRADFTQIAETGTAYGAIIAQVDSDRADAMSGSIYWSATGVPEGIGDISDPNDENADELWCDPCLLVSDTAARADAGG